MYFLPYFLTHFLPKKYINLSDHKHNPSVSLIYIFAILYFESSDSEIVEILQNKPLNLTYYFV
nr:MAG TPA: hypothetical protein [Caudoviricetes sp.]